MEGEKLLQTLCDAIVAFLEFKSDADGLLIYALQQLMRFTGASAGAVAIPGEKTEQPRILLQKFLGKGEPISRTALRAALSQPEYEVTLTEPPPSKSVFDAGISSILCAPIQAGRQVLAAIYLDRRNLPPFNPISRMLVATFSKMVAEQLEQRTRTERAESQAAEARREAAHLRGFYRFGEASTHSASYARVLQVAERLSVSSATLLLTGETGSGKEYLARLIHNKSEQQKNAFVALNCAAIPETLLESELFGYERGAFTGAVAFRRGLFEQAHGGTLFLDEIGDMPLNLQPKLLRVLDSKVIVRLGDSRERPVDVRIIAATNRDLKKDVEAGKFREDLYYRLSVVLLELPPLRERQQDIVPLARQFLEAEISRGDRRIEWSAAALRALHQYSWPGNIRELRNIVERLYLLADGPEIQLSDLQRSLPNALPAEPVYDHPNDQSEIQNRLLRLELKLDSFLHSIDTAASDPPSGPGQPVSPSKREPADRPVDLQEELDELAQRLIQDALARNSSITQAARSLGISRQNLSAKCKRLGIPLRAGRAAIDQENST